jgi:hypothetical protein
VADALGCAQFTIISRVGLNLDSCQLFEGRGSTRLRKPPILRMHRRSRRIQQSRRLNYVDNSSVSIAAFARPRRLFELGEPSHGTG